LYIETTSLAGEASAWLTGELHPPVGAACFRFWYHMNGDTVGTLSLYRLVSVHVIVLNQPMDYVIFGVRKLLRNFFWYL